MATTYHTDLQKLYVAYFNRPADPVGLAHYEGVLERAAAAGGATAVASMMTAISADFAKSAEYQATYSQATNTAVVTAVYQNLFGRAPDATGLAFYVQALVDKKMTIDTMVTFIANGATGNDKTIIDSKVTFATAFTNALDTEAEVTGYNVKDSQAAAKTLLAGIKTTAAATAAVAAIDTHVAAVIKAGVEFSLQTGLADLAAAQEARADFLEAFGEENDIEDAGADDVEDAVEAAELTLAAQIDDADFATASPGVQAAMIADQKELNADTLEAAQKSLKTAQDAVAKVTGLSGAIAASTSAAAAVTEAEEAQLDAGIALQNAQTNFGARNTAVTTTGVAGTDTYKILVDGDVVAEMDEGVLVVADDVDAADYTGLTGLVTAFNGAWNAEADLDAAEEAATLAQLRVELLDPQTTNYAVGKFTFTKTTPAATKPTYNEIVNELSALTAAAATATSGNQAAADLALSNFKGQIDSFIATNNTVLANAVIRAEEGSLAQTKAAIDAIDADDLADAVANQEALDDADEALTLAIAADATERSDFTTANSATPFSIATNGTVTVTAGGAQIVDLDPVTGNLVAHTGVTDVTNPGLSEYLIAANARIDAQEDYDVAEDALTQDQIDLIAANQTAVNAYNAAVIASNSSVAATRAGALGTEGSQEAIDDLADAEEDLVAANAAADQLESLDDAVTAAQDAFEDNDFAAPVMLETASAFGTTGSDIFVVGETDATITNFGRSGEDVLFIGTGYTLNTGAFATAGNNSVLEVFFVQQGNNTIVTIETETFGSNSAEAEIKITLTGVDADDLTFSNGIISI